MTEAKPRRPWLLASVALVVVMFVALLLAEGVLRLAGIRYPSFHEPSGLIPGATGWWTYEGRGWVSINSDGMRDVEHSVTKPANTLRIAVLGDSYAEAMQVNQEESYWAVMGQQLRQCPALDGRQVEVLNFGVSGYGTAQSLLRLKDKGLKYQPDLVLLGFTTGNDIKDNSGELEDDPSRPYFRLQDGRLTVTDEQLARQAPSTGLRLLWRRLVTHSRVAQLGNFVRLRMRARTQVASAPKADASFVERGVDGRVYLEPTEAVWLSAWRMTEALLRELHAQVKAGNAQLVIATLSNGIQVHPRADVRQDYMSRAKVSDLSYPDRRVIAYAQSLGVPAITLVPPLLQWAESTGKCVHGFNDGGVCDGHWNQDGHRLAGEIVSRELCAIISRGT